MLAEPSPEEFVRVYFGLDSKSLASTDPLLAVILQKTLDSEHKQQKAEQTKDYSASKSQAGLTKVTQSYTKPAWGEILRSALPFEWTVQFIDPVLGQLKAKKQSKNYPLYIHRLEKDLLYLAALAISNQSQLFISFPVSPVSLGILVVTYYAHLCREERDIYHTHHAVSAKDFVIWVRPKNNGQIQNLKTQRASHFEVTLSNRIVVLPIYKLNEPFKGNQLKVFMVRSLAETIDLLVDFGGNIATILYVGLNTGQTHA